jgi:ADP-ribose pyrophosphatase YjhB (NUDIX family)
VIDTIAEMRAFTGDIEREARSAAIREAREEAGVEIHDLELIHTSHCGANIEWDLYYYLTTDFDETGVHERDDEGESDLTIAWYTLDEVREKIISGDMSEDRSVAVILRWMMK